MKSRLTTLDIVTLVKELQKKLIGLRVDQVYDVDRKTYLIRLTKTDVKKMLLIESANRLHTTSFEWPKNPAPSGFTMKLRKHLKNKRVECIEQVGADRIVHLQFGAEEFAFHLYLELYDKGNIILTDHEFNILTLVRPHAQGEDRVAPHEKYVTDKAKTQFSLSKEQVVELLNNHPNKSLREIFLSRIEFGPALFAHTLKSQELTPQTKIPSVEDARKEMEAKLFAALEHGRSILEGDVVDGGFITYTTSFTNTFDKENKAVKSEKVVMYDQFHPMVLVSNFDESNVITFPTLDDAVDDFFSKIESQKLDMKQVNQERDALKKLDRVKEDQEKRLTELKSIQEIDKRKAELIMFNQELIEQTIAVIRQMVANQIPWDDIWLQIKEAQAKGDLLAQRITRVQLLKNLITVSLSDPYGSSDDSLVEVDIDLDLSAYANASKYFDLKKASAKKEERTVQSQVKALKSTEKKTMTTLREVAKIQQIKKARKVFWFEKFHWFISSENYLVLGGHDAQQNELLVKRYLEPRDVYLHAESHGAPTFIIKNDAAPEMIPPKTLNEACCVAVSYSGSWESKIIASAWWVWGDQVSKSAPTGEYLPTGSFMIRGKKNYLPPCQLVLGFGFLFRVSEESISRHQHERSRRTMMDDANVEEGSKQAKLLPESLLSPLPIEASPTDILEDEDEFPDVKVEIDLGIEEPFGEKASRERTRTISTLSAGSSQTIDVDIAPETNAGFVISSGVLPNFEASALKISKSKKKDQKKNPEKQTHNVPPVQDSQNATVIDQASSKSKRGQHGRLKKIKEKYKDQDDEERELRMQLLQSAGKIKESQSKGQPIPTLKEDSETVAQKPKYQPKLPSAASSAPLDSNQKLHAANAGGDEKVSEIEGKDSEAPDSNLGLLNCLTGCPQEEDELLFAVPVVAPYATLQNYKFRIKMLPGTAKRGKAARSALEIFLRDKLIRQREKDLLNSVKDQDLAKNFPGKVKLAAGADKK